tara:strand:- start:376 stop:747 length:372 start_codon:yes stop_codon:yes gene_type:complete
MKAPSLCLLAILLCTGCKTSSQISTNTAYYTDGSVMLVEELDQNKKYIKTTWYAPSGELIWETHWGPNDEGVTLFLDDTGAIRLIGNSREGLMHGPAFKFDPPITPTALIYYIEGDESPPPKP